MKKYIFTDLACEVDNEKDTQTKIISEAIKRITAFEYKRDKKIRHTVFFSPKLWQLNDNEFILLNNAVSEELGDIIRENIDINLDNGFSTLVVGLGNPHLTSDSLGAEAVKKITVMRKRKNVSVYAVTPDVMGNTGIDTVDVIRAYVGLVRPSVVIAVDALMAKSYKRLASTVQISDGGITPGGGLGAERQELSINTVGVPVISIGVPMAVNSSTMIAEALIKGGMNNIPDGISVLLKNGLDFFVTPKEADIAVQSAALLISSSIDLALSGFYR